MSNLSTTHKICLESADGMDALVPASVDLVVTSPPYPMIEMWDDIFFKQNKAIENAFSTNNFNAAFEGMHLELDKVWKSCFRVLKEGRHRLYKYW